MPSHSFILHLAPLLLTEHADTCRGMNQIDRRLHLQEKRNTRYLPPLLSPQPHLLSISSRIHQQAQGSRWPLKALEGPTGVPNSCGKGPLALFTFCPPAPEARAVRISKSRSSRTTSFVSYIKVHVQTPQTLKPRQLETTAPPIGDTQKPAEAPSELQSRHFFSKSTEAKCHTPRFGGPPSHLLR